MSKTIKAKRKLDTIYKRASDYVDKPNALLNKYLLGSNQLLQHRFSKTAFTVIWKITRIDFDKYTSDPDCMYWLELKSLYGLSERKENYLSDVYLDKNLFWFVTDSKRIVKKVAKKNQMIAYHV